MSGATPRRPAPPAVKEIARGGSGTIELAFRGALRGIGFQRMIAIKRLRPDRREEPEARRMFLQEARLTGELRHPNVVGVLDLGEDDEGPYLLMDFVLGLSLGELSTALVERGVKLPVQLGLRIGAAIARGLQAAHEATDSKGEPLGLTHRDVSPNNVLVGFDGVVRLVDFGLARALEDARSGELLRGTSGYLAPEQLRFEPIDARADLFALGVLLVELVSGERLYGDQDARVAAKRIVSEPVPDVRHLQPDLSEPVAALLETLLAKDPADRPTGAAEVYRQLEIAVRRRTLREGPLDLQGFLESHFEGLIQNRREELAGLWTVHTTGGFATSRAKPPSRRGRWVVAGAVAFALGGFTVALLADDDSAPSATSTADAGAFPPIVPPSPRDAGAALDAGTSSDAGLGPMDAGMVEDGGAEEPPRTRRRRRRRRNEGGRKLWEW